MDQTDPILGVAADIAAQLGETDPVPISQIKRMLIRLGEEQVRAFIDEALKIQREGGLALELEAEKRQRTLGGVFFKVAKDKVKSNDRYFIWLRPNQKKIPRMAWKDRLAYKSDLEQQNGEATTVKITLIGKPGKIIAKGDVVITSLKSEKAPSLSKQLPPAPDTPTNYVVFVAKKTVAESGRSY